jgi:hypothetical protein
MQRLRFSMVLVACVVLLPACKAQLKKAESELAEIAELLPGRYNNAAQSEEEAAAGRPAHAALALDIVRLDMPMLSNYVFYSQESAANDARRITGQRLMTFEPAKDGSIIETVYTFAEPGRWRDGHLNAGLFKSIMREDTKPLGGCDLLWKKDGEKFTATNKKDTCRVTSAALGSVKVDMRRELSADELAMAELSYTAGGKLVQGDTDEPFYRFRRGSAP